MSGGLNKKINNKNNYLILTGMKIGIFCCKKCCWALSFIVTFHNKFLEILYVFNQ